MAWTLNESIGVKGPKLRMYASGLVVSIGDVIVPTQWTSGINTATDIAAYHVTSPGALGSEPGANWPYAAEGTTGIACGTATLRSALLVHFDFSATAAGDGSQATPLNTTTGQNATLVSANGRVGLVRMGTTQITSTALNVGGSSTTSLKYSWLATYYTSETDRLAGKPKVRFSQNNTKYFVADGLWSDGSFGGTLGNGFTCLQGSGVQLIDGYLRNLTAKSVLGGAGGAVNGFMFNSQDSASLECINLWVEYCEADGCGGYGFGLESWITLQNAVDSAVFYRCKSSNNGRSKVSWGFGGYCRFTNGSGTQWARVGGAGTFIYSLAEANTIFRMVVNGGANFQQLTVNTATPTAPASGEWGQSAGTLYVNLGVDAGATLGTAYTLWRSFHYSDGARFIECESSRQHSSDGTGFGADTLTSGWIFERCYAHDNDGEGFVSNMSLNTQIRSNISERDCVVKRTTDGAISINNGTGLKVIHNRILDSNGLGVTGTCPSHAVTVVNNKVLRQAGTAIYTGSFHASSTTTPNSTVTTVETGTYLGGQDFFGSTFLNPPTSDAIQTATARTAVTRSAVTRSITTRKTASRGNAG